MKNIKLLIIGMLLLMIVPVIATEPDYTFKFGEDADFIVSCDVNGVPCDPSIALCNFTLRDPYGDYIIDFQPMTVRDNGDINYTVYTKYLTEIGKGYPGKFNCVQNGDNKTATFIAMITPTGEDRSVPVMLLFLGIGAFLTLFIGMKMENEYVGFVSGGLFIVAGIYSMIYGIGNLADLYTRSIAFASIGLGLLFSMAAGYKVVEEMLGEDRAF